VSALAVEARQVFLLALSRSRHEQRALAEFRQLHQRGVTRACHYHARAIQHLRLRVPIQIAVHLRPIDRAHFSGLLRLAQRHNDAAIEFRQCCNHAFGQHRLVRLHAGDRKEAVDVLRYIHPLHAGKRADVTQAVFAPVDCRVVAQFAGKAAIRFRVGYQDLREAAQQAPLAALDLAFQPARTERHQLPQRMQDAEARRRARPHAEPAVGNDAAETALRDEIFRQLLLVPEQREHARHVQAHAQIEDRGMATERFRDVALFDELAGVAQFRTQQVHARTGRDHHRDGIATLDQCAYQQQAARGVSQSPVVHGEEDFRGHRSTIAAHDVSGHPAQRFGRFA